MRERVRHLHDSLQAEKVSVYRAKTLVWRAERSGGGFRHPREVGPPEVGGFLTQWATGKRVAPIPQPEAFDRALG